MAIDSRSFIEPSLFHRHINANSNDIVAAIIQIVGNIVLITAIAAMFCREIETVHEKRSVPVNSLELHDDASAEISCRYDKVLSVPAYAVFGKGSAHGLVPMTVACFAVKRHLCSPVVRKVHNPPSAVIEVLRCRTIAVSCFGEIGEIPCGVVEISPGIVRMAKSKAPAGIHQQMLTRLRKRRGPGCHKKKEESDRHQFHRKLPLGVG